jgi:RHS repeat-associated protein
MYEYDGNRRMTERQDYLNSFVETFAYDGLGRLTGTNDTQTGAHTYGYDDLGNLTYADDVGTIQYAGPRPHAPSKFMGVTQNYDAAGNHQGDAARRAVTLNGSARASRIVRASDGGVLDIEYDAFGNRAATYGPGGTRLYFGDYELRGNDEIFHVRVGGRSVAMMSRKVGTSFVDTAYIHGDHLGSTEVVTANGLVVSRFSYDAWGARRDLPSTYDNANGGFDHGFTGHEHDDEWGVINMQGRLYDPAMRSMLSPDPVVVDPYASQAYNRYAYVLNDPLNLTDPTGFAPEGGACHECNFTQKEGSFIYGDPTAVPSGGQGRETDPGMAGVQADIAAGRLPSQMELAHEGASRLGRAMDGINMGPTGPGGLSRWTMNPGSSLGALVVFGDTQGRVENWETLTDDSASGGSRAGALGWEVLAVLPGAAMVKVAGSSARRIARAFRNTRMVTLYHGSQAFVGRVFSLVASRANQGSHTPVAGVYLTDDFLRAASGYGTGSNGVVVRVRVTKEVADSMAQMGGPGGRQPEFLATTQAQIDILNSSDLTVVPTADAIQAFFNSPLGF